MQTEYECVIGLEVHAQLLTESKMFCGCSAHYASSSPNSLVCPVCLGLPGAMPVINRRAIEFTIMTGLALECTIPSVCHFDRKNYPYPDLLKGYQISQYSRPVAVEGHLDLQGEGDGRTVRIIRVHLEEDTAKLTHTRDDSGRSSLVDANRSGVPLMEIVSYPDIRSPQEARLYLVQLRAVLQFLSVCTGNMEEGAFRVDANVSLRPRGSEVLGVKAEIKNMNSFRAVERAVAYEVDRQNAVLRDGGMVTQETRGWVEERGVTVSQRSKEYAHDYRYFPEPDLPPVATTTPWVETLRRSLPELPAARRRRFVRDYALSEYDAGLLTGSRVIADYFEEAARCHGDAKSVGKWITGELFRLLAANEVGIDSCLVGPAQLGGLLDIVRSGELSERLAKQVLEEMFRNGSSAAAVVSDLGLAQISGKDELEAEVDLVIESNPRAVADYKAGKAAAFSFLVGQVMQATKGKANPAVANEALRARLG